MASSSQFLAFDLGAESGRAVLGRLRAGILDVTEIHRFANEPVRQNGSLHWDVLRLWLEIKRGLERASSERVASIGVDAWGCDYALLGERGDARSRIPITIATPAPTASWKRSSRACRASDIYDVTGIQFLPFNTLYQLYAACRATPRLDRRRQRVRHDPGPPQLLADRRASPPSSRTRRRRSSSMRGRGRGRPGC